MAGWSSARFEPSRNRRSYTSLLIAAYSPEDIRPPSESTPPTSAISRPRNSMPRDMAAVWADCWSPSSPPAR